MHAGMAKRTVLVSVYSQSKANETIAKSTTSWFRDNFASANSLEKKQRQVNRLKKYTAKHGGKACEQKNTQETNGVKHPQCILPRKARPPNTLIPNGPTEKTVKWLVLFMAGVELIKTETHWLNISVNRNKTCVLPGQHKALHRMQAFQTPTP